MCNVATPNEDIPGGGGEKRGERGGGGEKETEKDGAK